MCMPVTSSGLTRSDTTITRCLSRMRANYLRFPLVGDRTVAIDFGDSIEKVFRRFRFGQVLVETSSPGSVRQSSDHEDDATLLVRSLGRHHTFNCLVYILIQRITSIRGDGDISVDLLSLGKAGEELATFQMCPLQVARKGCNHSLLLFRTTLTINLRCT